ncbi:hypothetical protein EDB19DRAFT_1909412 [Suillus lakei]|nr:hypothetical protein EDB19DRAFT_1909412 [Suillus lakei]
MRTSSKKQKTDGSGDSGNTNLKKAKKSLLPGNTPTNGAGSVDEDEPVDTNRPVIVSLTASLSPHPESVSSWHAVVHTEEEENALYQDDDNDDNTNANDNRTKTMNTVLRADNEADEMVEDKLQCLMKDWNSPVYAFFDLMLQIVHQENHKNA